MILSGSLPEFPILVLRKPKLLFTNFLRRSEVDKNKKKFVLLR